MRISVIGLVASLLDAMLVGIVKLDCVLQGIGISLSSYVDSKWLWAMGLLRGYGFVEILRGSRTYDSHHWYVTPGH